MDSLGLTCAFLGYDPSLGRFAQPDSLVPSGAQGMDRYAYVNNNPVRYTDPSGHKACDGAGVRGECDQSGIPGTFSEIMRALKAYGVTMTGNWSEEQAYAAYLGVATVAEKLAETIAGGAETAFRHVFGHVDFAWENNAGTCGQDIVSSGGCTDGAHQIRFWSLSGQWNRQLDRMAKNIVHELGHAFYHATGSNGTIGNSFTRDALRPNENGRLNWQQHPPSMNADKQDIPTELFADTFIAWTYDVWNTLNTDKARAAQDAMNGWLP